MVRLSQSTLTRIAHLYDIEPAGFGEICGGYRNVSHQFAGSDGRQYNFIVYKNEPGVQALIGRTNTLGGYLSQRGLPVRAPVDGRLVQLRAQGSGRYGCLYGYLEGETIAWEAYTMRHIKLLGMALADFHIHASDLTTTVEFPSVVAVYRALLRRMRRYFNEPGVREAMRRKLGVGFDPADVGYFDSCLRLCEQLSGQRILHMDFVRGNVLFGPPRPGDRYVIDNCALTGVIDLEKAAYGHPVFDIARTLAFLLVDCSAKPATKIYKYFIDSGYKKRGGLGFAPIRLGVEGRRYDALEVMVRLCLIHDFYKFLRQTPYESLEHNHHYRRTRDILEARKVIQFI